MKPASYRELQALEELTTNSNVTQRHLAEKLEVALGLTNLMIRRFVNKGYVKIVNIQKNRIRYLITPKGIAEKTRLTYEYLEYSLFLYRKVQAVLKETFGRVAQAGGRDVVFFGTGEIAEIAYLMLKEFGLNLVAVIDEQVVGKSCMGHTVMSVEALRTLSFDCGIVSSLSNGFDELRQRLQALGVPEAKIVVIENHRTRVRALPAGLDRSEGSLVHEGVVAGPGIASS